MPTRTKSLYQNIANQLRTEILNGEFRPSNRLPTEEEIGDRFEVSRNTVRLALALLANEGIITSTPGRGTYVREQISMKTQKELVEHELNQERIELKHRPELETRELAALYIQRGISEELADRLAVEVMRDPKVALEVHAREELGVDPNSLGSPWGAAFSSVGAFAVGAIIPLIPWLIAGGTAATVWAAALSAIAALCIGFLVGHFTDRNRAWSALRQLLIAAVAAGVTYGIGNVIGIGVS